MRTRKIAGLTVMAMTASMLAGMVSAAETSPVMPALATPPPVRDDGTVTVPSFNLPFSDFASREANEALVQRVRSPMPIDSNPAHMRQIADEKLIKPQLAKMRAIFATTSIKAAMGGVPVETFVPTGGIAAENKDRVLISVHGGGFITGGGGPGGALEAIPIAAVARIKVVAVDYRLQPEHPFPAAVEDTAAVYKELLKTYKPENIGIYGCSAGGLLSAQAIAWFVKEKIPVPGAIGVFCASNYGFDLGDSAQIEPRLGSVIPLIPPPKQQMPTDDLQYPTSKEVLKHFPPTLFLTGTRAPDMSGATQSHLDLRELSVKSELLLFDGMDHGFYSDATLPESQRAYRLIAQFFAENLGAKSSRH